MFKYIFEQTFRIDTLNIISQKQQYEARNTVAFNCFKKIEQLSKEFVTKREITLHSTMW